MNVEEIMTVDLVFVTPESTLTTVSQKFETHRFHHLLVVDTSQKQGDDIGRLVGVVSDRDVLRHMSPFLGTAGERPQDKETLLKRANEFMTAKVITVTPETAIRDAAAQMLRYGISCLPVVSADGRIAGIVTSRDVMRWTISQFDEQALLSEATTP